MQTPAPAARRRSRRRGWATALAVTATAGVLAPAARATPVAPEEEAIETGRSYHLVATNHGNRGATFEVNLNRDWALLTNDENSNGTAVVFERKGDGYTIRSTSSNWGGSDTWCSEGKGVALSKASTCATAWKVLPEGDGFKLEDDSRRTLSHSTDGKAWLRAAVEIYHGYAYTVFKAVKA
ncbi:hypothetical protein [Kitasatospora sp. NBC_00458]|uniref:hypothetical protein n=1 Tax=Kitasatospora sp. NBC_00458 TaxID=2903568 RepID=UPI002E178F6E